MQLEDLMKVKKQSETMRQNWLDVWEEIAYYVLPSKVGFNSKHVPGERQKWSRRFDTTAGQANKTLANHLHMALCSPSQAWFEGEFTDPELNKNDAAKEWAEDTTERMFKAFNYSNFNGKINTFFQTLCAFGTSNLEAGFISTPREPFSLVFKTVSLGDFTFDVNVDERIDTIFQDVRMSHRQAEQKFGKKFQSKSNTDYNGKLKFTKIIHPNEDFDPESLNPKKRDIMVVWEQGGEEILVEYEWEMPQMVARFDEIYDDYYGEGPAIVCLSDIRSINTAKRLEFRGYEKAIDPPLMGAPNGIIGDLHINAGGFTQVRDPRMIGEMPGQMNFQLAMTKGEELRDSIRKAYKIDELMVPERKGQNPATATEIQIRYEQMQKMMGATVGRIETELLKPLIKRVFGVMMRNGQFAEMPEEIAGADFDFRYTGPLAKSQISQDAVAVERLLQAEMALAQIDPAVIAVIDHEKAMRLLADRYSVPAIVIRSEKEVKQIQEAQAQQAAQQQQNQQAMEGAQAQQAQADADMANVELLQNVQGM